MAKMLSLICVFLLGLNVDFTNSASSDNFLPNFNQRHHHSKVVYFKDKESGDYGDNKKGHVVFHNPEQKKQYKVANPNSYDPHFDDGYKQSWKSLRSEKYQTETIDNPHSSDPTNKYLVKGIYQVREKLPYLDTTIGYDKEYLYPSADIDSDYHKSAQFVDFHNAKNDPFSGAKSGKTVDSAKPFEEFDPKKLEKVVDSAKVDPFPPHYENDFDPHEVDYGKSYPYSSGYEAFTPPKVGKVVQKPKQYHYSYKSPATEADYIKNVNLIDNYLAKTKPDVSLPLLDEPKNDFGVIPDYGYTPTVENYKSYDSLGPSDIQVYQNYKTDGPSLAHLEKEYGDYY